MEKLNLLATAAFGIEGIVSKEIEWLGFEDKTVDNGRVRFTGDFETIARANIWLRTADRVLIVLAEGKVHTFEDLFQLTKSIPWERWLPADAQFPVSGKSVNSVLHSVPDCQKITKKAIVERMKEKYNIDWFEETGAMYKIEVSILNDIAMITLDTTGPGLHKRGYREEANKAPIKETIAAAMILLSRYKKDRSLIDPFCGSGTIAIEAAMIARNIAPGLKRHFDFENWAQNDETIVKKVRDEATKAIDHEGTLQIYASDIDFFAVRQAKQNAELAGVGNDIVFQKLDFRRVSSHHKYGFFITNPPYGKRIGDLAEATGIYHDFGEMLKSYDTWSFSIITSMENFERVFGRRADKKRKLYNGAMRCDLYQFFGAKPPKVIRGDKIEAKDDGGEAK